MAIPRPGRDPARGAGRRGAPPSFARSGRSLPDSRLNRLTLLPEFRNDPITLSCRRDVRLGRRDLARLLGRRRHAFVAHDRPHPQAGRSAPTLTPQQSGTINRLQAISPVNGRVAWASGVGGTFVVTTDGGNTWRAGVVPGAEALEFRDVEGSASGWPI